MKSRLPLISILVIFISASLFAQVPRKVLMEYATNASCAPCAAYNPGAYDYLQNNYDRIVAVWYHAWWPGSGDPMYLANIPSNENRIYYYGVNNIGVPNYIIDGVYQGNPGNLGTLASQVDTRAQLESPIELFVSQSIQGDSLYVDIQLNVASEVTQSDLKLRTAIIEQMMKYGSPPGSNGETEFPQVFRRFCDGPAGLDLSNLSVGTSLDFSFTEKIDESWKRGVLGVVVWVQSDTDKEVIQAESTIDYLHDVTTEDSNFELIQINETITKNFTISNYSNESFEYKVYTDITLIEESWSVSLNNDGVDYETFNVTVAAGETKDFILNINTTDIPGQVDLDVKVENINSSINFTTSVNYFGLAVKGDILLIDDDGGEAYELNYIRALNNLSADYTVLDDATLSKVSGIINLEDFKTVIWNLGNELPTLTGSDVSLITGYLGGGGNLFIAGQDLAHDIFDISKIASGRFFFRFHLDAEYVSDSSDVFSVESVEGNPIIDGVNFEIRTDLYPATPDVVISQQGNSIPVLKFAGTENYAMLVQQKNNFKTAYLTIGLEQIPSTDTQDLLIEKVIDWFNTPLGIDGDNEMGIPEIYSLNQNYPNPFNPTTVISYQLPESANVKLKVYDVLGNEIAELVNENKAAGFYSIEFNASGLSSGIYFYSLTAGEFSKVNKMILLR